MAKALAWAPGRNRTQIGVGAVLVPPGTKLDRQMYLNLLGDRVRELVMADDDPQAAVARLVRALESAGLWSDQVNVTPETVGSVLVESNPQLWERLGILLEMDRLQNPQPAESPAARAQLEMDRQTPAERLESWVSAVSRLP